MIKKYIAHFKHGPWHKESRAMEGAPKPEILVPMLPAEHAVLAEPDVEYVNCLTAVYACYGPRRPYGVEFIYMYEGYRQ